MKDAIFPGYHLLIRRQNATETNAQPETPDNPTPGHLPQDLAGHH
jgi:hypothetical protein